MKVNVYFCKCKQTWTLTVKCKISNDFDLILQPNNSYLTCLERDLVQLMIFPGPSLRLVGGRGLVKKVPERIADST